MTDVVDSDSACQRRSTAASASIALLMFALYWSTLLPGMDLGDTASFQSIVGSRILTPRQAYPVYFAVGDVFVSGGELLGAEPAFALNLASAVFGALACAAICAAGSRLSGSAVGGLFASLLFGSSYTFWSQAVVAEVYALHIFAMALSLFLVLRWASRPSTGRLAIFFFAYALSFANHLSSILFLPGFALFLLISPSPGWRELIRIRIILLAILMAALGALPYLWNVFGMMTAPDAPSGIAEAARTFWFDVSKFDWRDSLVGAVPAMRLQQRTAMCWFDMRQQFGIAGVIASMAGVLVLVKRAPRGAMMLTMHYLVAFFFAFTYNVGDVHVFFLPSHLVLALFTAPAAAALVSSVSRLRVPTLDGSSTEPGRIRGTRSFAALLVAMLLFAYPAWRIFDTWPLVDRSQDRRPLQAVQRFAEGLSPDRDVLGSGLSWELQNGLDYYARRVDPSLVKFRIRDVLPHFPFFVRDNLTIGRNVLLVGSAASEVAGAYGDLFAIERDPRVAAPSFEKRVGRIARGAPYVLCVLTPNREYTIDRVDVDRAARALGQLPLPAGDYVVVVGRAGSPPTFSRSAARPFRERVYLEGASGEGDVGLRVDVRIESWLTFDTIRRAGFGHVLINGNHALTIERGVSFVAMNEEGLPVQEEYEANVFAPQARDMIRVSQ